MAIQDVQDALVAAGTVARQDGARVSVTDGTTIVTSQVAWFGSIASSSLAGLGFRLNPSTQAFEFATVPKIGTPSWNTATIVGYDANYVLISSSGVYYLIANNPTLLNGNTTYPITDLGTAGPYTPPAAICFVEGTRIRTTRGEVAVEDLVVGDRAWVFENGEEITRPVIWIGYRDINLAGYPDPFDAQPIRIRRDAFGQAMPSRDLMVSPDHAIFVRTPQLPQGVLVPARLLVNNMTIERETRLGRVRYYHVELDRHAVLFAENLPSESYLDTGNRSFFQNNPGPVDLYPVVRGNDAVTCRETESCAPFVYAASSTQPIWQRIARRAEQLGYRNAALETTDDPMPVLRMAGHDYRPIRSSGRIYSFMVPSSPDMLQIVSRAARPCDTRPWIEDRRLLGVAVRRIRVRQNNDVTDVALDGPALGEGWWALEREGVELSRWTNGAAELHLPAAEGSTRVVEVAIAGGLEYPVSGADGAHGTDAARSA